MDTDRVDFAVLPSLPDRDYLLVNSQLEFPAVLHPGTSLQYLLIPCVDTTAHLYSGYKRKVFVPMGNRTSTVQTQPGNTIKIHTYTCNNKPQMKTQKRDNMNKSYHVAKSLNNIRVVKVKYV
jgi:hypothetical protein